MVRGLIVAAPASGSGKTTVTLGLARALAERGARVAPFKVGPDFIDPGFLAAAAGRPAVNLDPWAMRPGTLARLSAALARDADIVLGEGVMGLFDGASDGTGSTADLSVVTGWPVVLVIDVRGQAASAAAVVRGFASHRQDVRVAGVVFNRVGSERHGAMLTSAVRAALPTLPILGCLPRSAGLELPSRHLGLVPAAEQVGLGRALDAASSLVERHLDLDSLTGLAAPLRDASSPIAAPAIPPIGQRIAVASDEAFAFAYPHLLGDWHEVGAEVVQFSPLADEPAPADADAIYLPGGYPELHAGRLAAAGRFLDSLRAAAARRAAIYGECGGYMTLGRGLVDADGARHAMAGLLPLETSFATRRLSLGYRRVTLAADCPLGRAGSVFRGHEFHYATVLSEGPPRAPFAEACDAAGEARGSAGSRAGTVAGSFLHLVDRG